MDNASLGGRAIVDVATGEVRDLPTVVEDLGHVRHVYVGEIHGSGAHQRVQVEVARALQRSGRSLVIGVEWLPALTQPALDAWVAGQIDEATLLERVRWKQVWGHGFEAYRAVFQFAAQEGIRIVGLNPPSGLAEAVGRGGTDAVPQGLRDALPPLDTANEPHRKFFLDRFLQHQGFHGHGPGHFDAARLERYYQAQLVRDETMALGVVRVSQTDPSKPEVVLTFAGLGHVDYGLGVPNRAVGALGPHRIVLPVETGEMAEAASTFLTPSFGALKATYAWEAPPPAGEVAWVNQ